MGYHDKTTASFAGTYEYVHEKPHTRDSQVSVLGYRCYSPGMARWLSRDPIGERGGRNLYVFVRNNPIAGIDSLGLRTCQVTTEDYEVTLELTVNGNKDVDWTFSLNVKCKNGSGGVTGGAVSASPDPPKPFAPGNPFGLGAVTMTDTTTGGSTVNTSNGWPDDQAVDVTVEIEFDVTCCGRKNSLSHSCLTTRPGS